MAKRKTSATLAQLYDETALRRAALHAIMHWLSLVASTAHFYLRRAWRRGINLTLETRIVPQENGVFLSITYRPAGSDVDVKELRKWLVTRAMAVERMVRHVAKCMENTGIHVNVSGTIRTIQPLGAENPALALQLAAGFDVFVELVGFDAERMLTDRMVRRWVFWETSRPRYGAGGVIKVGDLKRAEAEAFEEYERGAAAGAAEEGGGVAGEEGEGEEPVGERAGDTGAGERAEGEWLRLKDAVLRYGLPVAYVEKAVMQGRVRSWVDPRRGMYVSREDVERLAEEYRNELERERRRKRRVADNVGVLAG
jgi:hypothetical protein